MITCVASHGKQNLSDNKYSVMFKPLLCYLVSTTHQEICSSIDDCDYSTYVLFDLCKNDLTN